MRTALSYLLALFFTVGASRADAQSLISPTYEGSPQGGWSAPCEDWWSTSEFTFNALRVCRVATYLVRSLRNSSDTLAAQAAVNQMFRICWGTFPRAGANCSVPNAYAYSGSWINWAKGGGGLVGALPHPMVITLHASERVQSDDEMAFLLAHEMGHALDSEQTATVSAENEYRADVIGIGFVVNAGFDARAAGRGLQMIGGERGQGAMSNLLAMLLNHVGQALTQDVHGFTQERIARMQKVFVTGCAALHNKPIGCKEGWK